MLYLKLALPALLLSPFVLHAEANLHEHPRALLNNALEIGVDRDGKTLFLCQARLFNSLQPGRTWAGFNGCKVTFSGKEYNARDYKIPQRAEFGSYHWGQGLRHAPVVGKDVKGAPLYLCQSSFRGSLQPGKTWPNYNYCNINYKGKEIITNPYKVLNTRPTKEIIVSAPNPRNLHTHH